MSDDDKLFSSATVASIVTLQQYKSDVPKDQISFPQSQETHIYQEFFHTMQEGEAKISHTI